MLDGIVNWFNSLGATALGRLLPFVLIIVAAIVLAVMFFEWESAVWKNF